MATLQLAEWQKGNGCWLRWLRLHCAGVPVLTARSVVRWQTMEVKLPSARAGRAALSQVLLCSLCFRLLRLIFVALGCCAVVSCSLGCVFVWCMCIHVFTVAWRESGSNVWCALQTGAGLPRLGSIAWLSCSTVMTKSPH